MNGKQRVTTKFLEADLQNRLLPGRKPGSFSPFPLLSSFFHRSRSLSYTPQKGGGSLFFSNGKKEFSESFLSSACWSAFKLMLSPRSGSNALSGKINFSNLSFCRKCSFVRNLALLAVHLGTEETAWLYLLQPWNTGEKEPG